MKFSRESLMLYAVTDRSFSKSRNDFYRQIEDALKGGVTCVQLREKELDDGEFLEEAVEISHLCRSYGVPFIVNDRADIALASHADGVHLGQEDLKISDLKKITASGLILGISAHNTAEAVEAQKLGADYLGLGAVFATSTKKDVDVMPFETLKNICMSVNIPTVAIGGINEKNIMTLADSGTDGIAVVSALFGAGDVRDAAGRLRALSLIMRDRTDGERKI